MVRDGEEKSRDARPLWKLPWGDQREILLTPRRHVGSRVDWRETTVWCFTPVPSNHTKPLSCSKPCRISKQALTKQFSVLGVIPSVYAPSYPEDALCTCRRLPRVGVNCRDHVQSHRTLLNWPLARTAGLQEASRHRIRLDFSSSGYSHWTKPFRVTFWKPNCVLTTML